jgi:hypothetical protein
MTPFRQKEPDQWTVARRVLFWGGVRYYFWKFVHNALIHPLLAFPWEPKWAQQAHDWTAKRCPGGG